MLHRIPARIVGSQVVWLGAAPPAIDANAPVMVVWDDARPELPKRAQAAPQGVNVRDLAGRLKWTGDALAQQQAQRNAW